MQFQGGQNVYGVPLGILGLETYYAKLPGHIKNASTFPYPVIYRNVKGAVVGRLLNSPDVSLLPPFIEAVQELEREGVRAIAGSCGFLAIFQEELADAVNIPLFTSSLMLIPLISRTLRRSQKVGVLTASKKGLTDRHLRSAGCEGIPLVVAGMDDLPEFREVILENKRIEMDGLKLQDEIVDAADQLVVQNPDIGALVLECTDMPPYAHLIQRRIKRPVFDLISLTNLICQATTLKGFEGIMPT
jgi:hypothetical protein